VLRRLSVDDDDPRPRISLPSVQMFKLTQSVVLVFGDGTLKLGGIAWMPL